MNSSAHEVVGGNCDPPGKIRTLVVGYGNELRRDDGAGPMVARTIGEHHVPGVAVETFHQLLPEHAARIASAEVVIFVDATQDGAEKVSVRRIHPAIQPEFCGHRCDPETLLYWCCQFVSQAPHAWFVQIPGTDFEIGDGLSPSARCHVREGVASILGMITENG